MQRHSSYDSTDKLLLHILQACDEIAEYTKDLSYEAFVENTLVLRAKERCLEIIGEAATKKHSLDPDSYPNISWIRMRGLRNRLVHDYLGTDYKIVFDSVVNEIPRLRDEIRIALGI